MNWRRVSWVCSYPHLASSVLAVFRSPRLGSRRGVELGRKAGCSRHRDALEDRESNPSHVVAVVDRNRRGSCLLRRGCFLLSNLVVMASGRQKLLLDWVPWGSRGCPKAVVKHSGLLVDSHAEAGLAKESARCFFVGPSRTGRRYHLVRLIGCMTWWCVSCWCCAFNLSAAMRRTAEQAKTRIQGVAQRKG